MTQAIYRTGVAVATFASLVLAFPGQTRAAGPDLVSHEAIYDIAVDTGVEADVEVQAAGQVTIRAERTCPGWRIDHRLEVALVMTGAAPFTILSDIGFDENRDGRGMDFFSTLRVNGVTVEQTRGRARLQADSGAGQALFEQPEQTLIDLPPGTLLPVRAFQDSFASMLGGTRAVEQIVFDGSSVDGPVRVSDLLLGDAPDLEVVPDGDAALAEGPYLRILSSYSDLEVTDSEPRSVQRADIAANGVTARWAFRLDTIPLEATLTRIRQLPAPAC